MIATADSRFEMTDPNAWHYVRPMPEPTLSLMMTWKTWDRPAP
jgi:hypothetical protein